MSFLGREKTEESGGHEATIRDYTIYNREWDGTKTETKREPRENTVPKPKSGKYFKKEK